MTITSIRFDFPEESSPGVGELLAFVSVELDASLVIKRMRVVAYPDGRIAVFMPSRMVNDKFEDVVYPSSRTLRDFISCTILDRLSREFNARGDNEKRDKVKTAFTKMCPVAA